MPRVLSVLKKTKCQNCGSMSHNTRDCLERPRKYGAKGKSYTQQAMKETLDVQQLEKEKDALDENIQKVLNEKNVEDFLVSSDEIKGINDIVNKKRMAVKNLRELDDVAPYLKDLTGGDATIERKVEDIENVWEEEKGVSETLAFLGEK
ncbi:hypothetical protein EIN_312840 [Entamoeba invadens IP1]|uniref:CCHC-type domain-containing protein n=1 Tax=Entamoeba invadens IP1 TaxID=370355 RepID=A0A0A1UCD4_ENTIV|nr:hypothetical protein EIN_312840 [Entamoeba invadens IP1]ELP92912.1 hypothetical protein EIN_312840 [Entamoeba invadens IP1]|eukprot:XP_004259683.1 hypothetical protein EIN_312840 [Entamoeba invadens IP1]